MTWERNQPREAAQPTRAEANSTAYRRRKGTQAVLERQGPGGEAGVTARTDANRGVWKAPAGMAAGGPANDARFKWDGDNGSVAWPTRQSQGSTLPAGDNSVGEKPTAAKAAGAVIGIDKGYQREVALGGTDTTERHHARLVDYREATP